jgi:TetR/AcrR family transcriptional repressor of mexJK operon
MMCKRFPQKPGPKKDPAKASAILEAAATLFLRQGYSNVTMDDIAAHANVSKLTVYKHFGRKRDLFIRMIHGKLEAHLSETHYQALTGQCPETELLSIAKGFVSIIYSPEGL